VEGRPLEDTELIERARRGDVVAYGQLVQRHQEVAVRTAYLACGDATEAEDAAQEGFLKAYAAIGRFRPDAPFRPWILRIVVNEARNRRRSAGRRTGLALRTAEDRPADDAAPSPEAAVLAAEARRDLLAALERLGDDDRMVIGCRYLLELSEAETAATLGIPRGTVKSRLSRALGRMRTTMTGEVAR
jgi:RNA polymerase sigma factor (sigma-70 family)